MLRHLEIIKISIIGNTGAGKTTLALSLKRRLKCEILHLDEIVWTSHDFKEKTPSDIQFLKLDSFLNLTDWVIEGVYGDLIQKTLASATHLIWIDLEWHDCLQNILKREHVNSSEESLSSLIKWGENYESREFFTSKPFHEALFTNFKKKKYKIKKLEEIDSILVEIFSKNHI